MAVTTEDILAMGKGPAQATMDAPAPQAATQQAATPAPVAQTTTQQAAVQQAAPATASTSPTAATTAPATTSAAETTAQTSTDVEHTTPVPSQQQGAPGKKLSYVELYNQINPYRPPTPEEVEKERKKQKREAIFAAIGEGISAMSNLYFTTQYAPNAFDPSKGMAATTKARFDRLKKEREDNNRQYMEGLMRAMRWDAEDDRDDRNWKHTIERWNHALEREKIEDRRNEAKDARDKAMVDLNEQLMRHKISGAEYDAAVAKVRAEYAEETEKLKLGNLRAEINQRNASAAASREKTHHFLGKTYTSDKDYTKDVTEAARAYNERHMEEIEVEEDDGNGGKRKRKRRQYKEGFVPIQTERVEQTGYGQRTEARRAEEFAGEVERRLADEEKEEKPKNRTNVKWK